MTNKQPPSSIPGLCRFLGSAGALGLVLLCLFGCASQQGWSSSSLESDSTRAQMASLDTQGETTAQKTTHPQVRQDEKSTDMGQNSQVVIESEGEKHTALIPVPEQTTISPRYKNKTLELSFDPPLPSLHLPSSSPGQLIKDMRITPDSHGTHSLRLMLAQDVRFLVTREQPSKAQVSLVPDQDSQADTDPNLKGSSSPELKDIDFQAAENGDLLLQLTATRSFDYRLPPGKKNELRLFIPHLHVPSRLIKLYQLSKFQSAVSSALLTRTQDGAVLVLGGINEPVPASWDEKTFTLRIPAKNGQGSSSDQTSRNAENSQDGNNTLYSAPSTLNDERHVELFPGMKEEYTGAPISLNLQDADIKHVLRLIAEVGDYNLILDESVSGTISLKLDRVPWDQTLDLVLQQKGLGLIKHGNILRIAPADTLEKEQERIIKARQVASKARQSEEDAAPLYTEYIQINYTKARDLQSNLEQFLSERGQISHDAKTNQLIISDTARVIEKIRNVVRKLDRAERQVLIEARLVYATDEFQRSMGIKWGGSYSYENDDSSFALEGIQGNSYAINTPSPEGSQTTLGLGTFFSKLSGNSLYTLDAQLELGESQNQLKTISSPRVVTLNNQLAEITQGTKIATKNESESGGTTTEYVEATLKLAVTPQITPDNKLILELDISDDSPTADSEDIETRSVQTRLFVDNDQTVVIGGVQQINQSEQQDRVPGLSRVPLLGWLFKNKYNLENKRELLIFIRPHILES
ncbi:MAG: type IV pilus secretin PilQ [Desulfovermiculus sp.]